MKEKVIISGHIVEVIGYQRLNTGSQDMENVRQGTGIKRQENYANRQKTRRDMIRRIVTANFTGIDSRFQTLTFADNVQDLKIANQLFKKYIRKLRIRYGPFKYVAVIEFQKRGAIHYHLLTNLPYIPVSDLTALWGQGWVKVNKVDHVDNLGAYLIKYMTKDNADERLMGEKGYLMSSGLTKPLQLKTWVDGNELVWQVMTMYGIDKKTPSYEATYESEHNGTTRYLQYNLSRQTKK